LDITLGPDNNLWFTATPNKIGKMTSGGTVTMYTVNAASVLNITRGRDGNLWYTTGAEKKIGKMNTSGTVVAEYTVPSYTKDIVHGTDNNIWYTTGTDGNIGKITLGGLDNVEYPIGSATNNITVAADSLLWYTAGTNIIGTISYAGTAQSFTSSNNTVDVSNSSEADVSSSYTKFYSTGTTKLKLKYGSVSNEWDAANTISNTVNLGYMQRNGSIAYTTGTNKVGVYIMRQAVEYTVTSTPNFITAGPDGYFYYTTTGSTNKIGKIFP
jgi:hypothetical protein